MTIYGYARVSTADQNLDMQINALRQAGCEKIFKDHGVGGTSDKRTELKKALDALQPGDVLVVWRLDRLARSMFELVDIVQALHERKIAFRSLCEYIDVNSAFGELVLHILSAIAHFERALIVERTKAGLDAARKRGVRLGRKPRLNEGQYQQAISMTEQGERVEDVAAALGVGRSTMYRYMRHYRAA